MGYFIRFSIFFGWKYILNRINSEFKKKIDCYIVSDLRFLLKKVKIQQAILLETSPFLSAQMAVLSSFFQVFRVLGMYNFGVILKNSTPLTFSRVKDFIDTSTFAKFVLQKVFRTWGWDTIDKNFGSSFSHVFFLVLYYYFLEKNKFYHTCTSNTYIYFMIKTCI